VAQVTSLAVVTVGGVCRRQLASGGRGRGGEATAHPDAESCGEAVGIARGAHGGRERYSSVNSLT
jgi:hypothetical protein